jgi:hypothetical protein
VTTVMPSTDTSPAGRAVERSLFVKALQASELPVSLKCLLLILAWNGDASGGDRWQSSSQLALACTLSKRQIQKLTRNALQQGWLIVARRPGGRNLWQLAMPIGLKPPAAAPRRGVAGDTPHPRHQRHGGVSPTTPGGVTHDTPVVKALEGLERTGGAPAAVNRHPAWPSWCGHCNPDTRHLERGAKSIRCPQCSPLLRTASGRLKASLNADQAVGNSQSDVGIASSRRSSFSDRKAQ